MQAKILASDLINAVNKFYLMELVKSKQVKTDYQKLGIKELKVMALEKGISAEIVMKYKKSDLVKLFLNM